MKVFQKLLICLLAGHFFFVFKRNVFLKTLPVFHILMSCSVILNSLKLIWHFLNHYTIICEFWAVLWLNFQIQFNRNKRKRVVFSICTNLHCCNVDLKSSESFVLRATNGPPAQRPSYSIYQLIIIVAIHISTRQIENVPF